MNPIRRLGLGLALLALWAGSAAPTFAADNGTVDAQVTVATPCILITNPTTGSIDFGTLPFSSGNVNGTAQQLVAYANCGTAAERIWAAGTDATGPAATWQLDFAENGVACSQPLNTYRLDLSGLNGSAVQAILDTNPVQLETLGAPFETQVSVALAMPCVGSDGAGETMSFQILFTATF